MEDCKIHDMQIATLEHKVSSIEEDLKHIRENVHQLLGRNNDFVITVINGKTEKRLASELIGEMYVGMKELRNQTPKGLLTRLNTNIVPIINFITLIGLILALLNLKG